MSGICGWDALKSNPNQTATRQCSYRLKRDLKSLCMDPLHGIMVVPDESDFFTVHAMIIGTSGTPYEKGFFYFILRCPPDYPVRPPNVRLMTTGGGQVRFNPNLYDSGKVCLSILGTYPGPAWSSAMTIGSVLLSIQSIMNENPYHNEPGVGVERQPGHSALYNRYVVHETMRVAVCGMLKNDTGFTIPPLFITAMREK